MKVKIFSAFDHHYSGLSDFTFQTVENYCNKHGYDCERVLVRAYDRMTTWYKIKHFLFEIEKNTYDYLIWIDTDAIIYNDNFDLNSILEENKFLYIAKDFNGFNAGVIILKANDYMKSFLERVYANTKFTAPGTHQEQASIFELVENNDNNIQEHVKWVPQNILNAYDYNLYGFDSSHWGHFNLDSFIVHYPAQWPHIRIQEMTKILNLRK